MRQVDFGKKPWKSIKGIGPLTFKYFCMLAGDGATIKLDIHLKKLVTCIISTRRGEKYSNCYLEKLVLAAAKQLGISAKTLDNWLWDHARSGDLCPKCGFKHWKLWRINCILGETLRQTVNNSEKTASRVHKPVSMAEIQVESDFKKPVLLTSKHPCIPCDRAELYLTWDRQLNKDNYAAR